MDKNRLCIFIETVVCTAVWLNDSMLNSYSGWNQYNKPQAILCMVWALNPSRGLRANCLWKYNFIFLFIYFFISCASLQGTKERESMTKAHWIMTERFLCACECKNALATMGRKKIILGIINRSFFFSKDTSNISSSWHTVIIQCSYQGKINTHEETKKAVSSYMYYVKNAFRMAEKWLKKNI